MNGPDIARIRHRLGKTQAEMASLLGVSSKAVQSFEQGWRSVPGHVERQALFLLFLKGCPQEHPREPGLPCWEARDCDRATRSACPAWEVRAGHLCWFINGTFCHGQVQENWATKMQLCRSCEVLRSAIPAAGFGIDDESTHVQGEDDA